jgi:hypothetical protein
MRSLEAPAWPAGVHRHSLWWGSRCGLSGWLAPVAASYAHRKLAFGISACAFYQTYRLSPGPLIFGIQKWWEARRSVERYKMVEASNGSRYARTMSVLQLLNQ